MSSVIAVLIQSVFSQKIFFPGMAQAPRDRYHFAYGIVFFQGLAALLPWNLFITADAYFASRFHETWIAESFLNWFSISFNLSTLITISLCTSPLRIYLPSLNKQVMLPLLGNTILMFITTILVKIPSFHGTSMFWFTLCTIVMASVNASVLQSAIFSITTHFPEKYTQAFMAGQGLAGLLVSLCSFLITWAHHAPESIIKGYFSSFLPTLDFGDALIDICAFLYFLTGLMVLLVSILFYQVFIRLPITKYYLNQKDHLSTEKLLDSSSSAKTGPIVLLKQLKWYAASVFIVFFVTLAVFPAMVASLGSVDPSRGRLFRELFVPFLFVLFNFGDLLGRIAAGRWIWHHPRILLILAGTRVIFVLLFQLCNISTSTHVLFHHDIFPFVFVFLCSFTNGYYSSLAMMLSPTIVNEQDQELGACVMFFMLSLGLTLGSSVSFLF